jgi:hypothetical protein
MRRRPDRHVAYFSQMWIKATTSDLGGLDELIV